MDAFASCVCSLRVVGSTQEASRPPGTQTVAPKGSGLVMDIGLGGHIKEMPLLGFASKPLACQEPPPG